MTTNGKSSQAIERDVEMTRARLSGKLDELRDRISPQQVMEDLMDYARGGEMMSAIGKSVKENPMPLLLIGAGIGWMMMTGQGQRQGGGGRSLHRGDGRHRFGHGAGRLRGGNGFEEEMRSQGMHPYGVGAQGMDYARDHERGRVQESHKGPGWASRAGESASSAASGVGERASAAAGSIGEAATSAWHGLTHRASDAASAVSEAAGSARHEAGRRAAGFGESTRRSGGGAFDAIQGQPLVLAAVGLAVGAAIGAALPGSDTEDEWFGESSDRMKHDAERLGKEQYDKAKAVAERAYGEGEEEARRQGLTGNGHARPEEPSEAEKRVGPMRH